MKPKFLAAGGGLVAASVAVAIATGLGGASADAPTQTAAATATATPIKHVVVIFDENESFDHYFGTYPNASNPPGEPVFNAKSGTPSINGLTSTLLNANPNTVNPRRIDRSQAVTCSQNHNYAPEQLAEDGGLMDKFVQNTAGSCTDSAGNADKGIVMGYYDGNTVTGLWNLAQNFSLNDNSYGTTFGPSTVGAINLISGQTHGASDPTASGVENGTVIGDPDPSTALDDCGTGTTQMSGKNVGDLMNANTVSWGWFEGGFRPDAVNSGKAACTATHTNVAGGSSKDYSPHHEPFEYYPSTANPHHTAPASPFEIGHNGPANHQYDLADFDTALANGDLPSVTFLKPAQYEDAHPSNSDPLDEQTFIAQHLDALENSSEWSSTAVIIAYDDSDGWYDHQPSPTVNSSRAQSDGLNGPGVCGKTAPDPTAYPDRCGYGPRQPLLVISPYAKQNYVDHTLTDQTSVLKFIEDNWGLGQIGDQSLDAKAGTLLNMFNFAAGPVAPKIFLDPSTGLVTKTDPMPGGGSGSGDPSNGGGGSDAGAPAPAAPVAAPAPASTPAPAATDPAPAPAAPPAPAATPIPTSAASTSVGRPSTKIAAKAPKVTCVAGGKGKKINVTCKTTGGTGTRTALRFRVTAGGKAVANGATMVRNGKAATTLHTHKALKKGQYKLTVTVSTAGAKATSSGKSIKLG